MAKKVLEFFDVATKKKFKTSDYKLKTKKTKSGMRTFAIAKSPTGDHEVYRIVAKDFKG